MHALLKNHTILYVEDDANIRKHMCEYLEAFFGEVYTAADGMEGWQKYQEMMPSAVILDIDLPHMDGLSIAQQIRERDKETSILMMTAYTKTPQLIQAAELKLLKYLVKPVDIAVFDEMLHALAQELMENSGRYVCLGEGYGWDVRKKKMLHQGEEVSLTAKERQMLALLVKHRHQPVSFEEIMIHVWADEIDRDISVNCIKNIISDLRKKLPHNTIKSIYGKEYVLQ
jgi:two-component system response regulator VanR